MNNEINERFKNEIEAYFKNNARKLHEMVDNVLKKLGFCNVRVDDYYSLAHEIFYKSLENYDESRPFDGFIYSCLYKKFCTHMTKANRLKRGNYVKVKIVDEYGNPILDDNGNIVMERIRVPDQSIETPLNDENDTKIKDVLRSDYNLESEVLDNIYSEKVDEFLRNLPVVPRKIAEMIADGNSASEIKEILGLTDSQYNSNFEVLKKYENIQILKGKGSEEDDEMEMTQTTTMENCKTDKISIASIIKKMDKHTLRFDHPLQRESDQWTSAMKGNLVSDILQGNRFHPLIFAEQIINGVPIIWDLDGKQRCTNAYSYANNGYKVSKKIRRWNIKYQTVKKDENGNDILDEGGFPIAENAEFDIRGKRFSDLPEELQDRFMDYTFNYDQYLNCSEEDIGYHIERYNDGKSMSKAQKGITKIGTEFAEMIKSIANMEFFKSAGGYKVSSFKNGAIDRVVAESIMATNYFDNWRKEPEDICKYLKDNASIEEFENFEDMVERLEKVVTDDVANMFDEKDTFLYFGLFARFAKTGLDDKKFVEFMAEFARSLHSKQINGVTYDELCINKKTNKPLDTKDRYVIVPKMEFLEAAMKEYLLLDDSPVTPESFIVENVEISLEEIKEDMKCYEDTLDDLELKAIKDGSKLLNKDNRLSLLAMVAYSYKNNVDLDDWLSEYVKENNTYFTDQKKNYLHMLDDFQKFQQQREAA